MPLFSFLEFQDINLTSAEQRGDTRKLNLSSPWDQLGTPSCPRGVGAAEMPIEGGLTVCREHRSHSYRDGLGVGP